MVGYNFVSFLSVLEASEEWCYGVRGIQKSSMRNIELTFDLNQGRKGMMEGCRLGVFQITCLIKPTRESSSSPFITPSDQP